jgi:hypothetical protein
MINILIVGNMGAGIGFDPIGRPLFTPLCVNLYPSFLKLLEP